MRRPPKEARWALVLALVVAAGCGKAGPPKPLESDLPEMVRDLTARSSRGAVELGFSVPQKNQDGSKPPDVVGFQVMRALLPLSAETSVTQSKPELAFVLPVPLDADGQPLKKVALRDMSAVAGTVNVYRVVTFGSGGYGTVPSNPASIAWAVPPTPPPVLEAEGIERAATLRWTAPGTKADTTPEARPLAYRVYRFTAESEPELLTATPIAETTFTDSTVSIDRATSYVVRTAVQAAGTWIESDDSPTASVVSEDRTPPAAPAGLVGVRAASGNELRWDPSPDADVAGYNVYRLRPNGAGERLTPDPIESTRFVDPRPPLGDVRYRVTAVDKSANPNESAPTPTITVP